MHCIQLQIVRMSDDSDNDNDDFWVFLLGHLVALLCLLTFEVSDHDVANFLCRAPDFVCLQVHQLERDVSNLRGELVSRGHEESEMWQERSELIDDKARLGRQIIELSKRAQQAEADLAISRATARALASNNAELQEQLAVESSAHTKLEQR